MNERESSVDDGAREAGPMRRLWQRVRPVLTSRTARRIYAVLLILLVAFLWANMVRRALAQAGSQYDGFVQFSRDLIYERINVYEQYPAEHTITKYPPFFSLLFAPLVPLPTVIGASFWFLLNLGLSVGATYFSVLTVWDRPERRKQISFFVIPFVLAAGIIGSNLETAQVNIVIVFFLCLALYAYRRGAGVATGLILGFITALKLTPGLFIAYFAYKRAWRPVLGAVAGLAVCWLVLPPLVFGFEHFVGIMQAWLDVLNPFIARGTLAEGIQGFRHTNQSLSAVLHRFLTETPAGAGRTDFYLNLVAIEYGTMDLIVKGLDLAILGFLAWICRTPVADRDRIGLTFEYSLVMIATLFISPISWINHYVILLFPYAAAVYYLKTRSDERPRWRILLYATAASFVLVSSSASRLMQAFSLPFLGALVLFAALAYMLRARNRLNPPAV